MAMVKVLVREKNNIYFRQLNNNQKQSTLISELQLGTNQLKLAKNRRLAFVNIL